MKPKIGIGIAESSYGQVADHMVNAGPVSFGQEITSEGQVTQSGDIYNKKSVNFKSTGQQFNAPINGGVAGHNIITYQGGIHFHVTLSGVEIPAALSDLLNLATSGRQGDETWPTPARKPPQTASFIQGERPMKIAKIANNIDDALLQLQTAQSTLKDHVASADAARAVAAMMQAPLDSLLHSMERLMDKGQAKK